MGIPAQQAAKTTRPLMPAATPTVLLLSMDTQQAASNIILAMTRSFRFLLTQSTYVLVGNAMSENLHFTTQKDAS